MPDMDICDIPTGGITLDIESKATSLTNKTLTHEEITWQEEKIQAIKSR